MNSPLYLSSFKLGAMSRLNIWRFTQSRFHICCLLRSGSRTSSAVGPWLNDEVYPFIFPSSRPPPKKPITRFPVSMVYVSISGLGSSPCLSAWTAFHSLFDRSVRSTHIVDVVVASHNKRHVQQRSCCRLRDRLHARRLSPICSILTAAARAHIVPPVHSNTRSSSFAPLPGQTYRRCRFVDSSSDSVVADGIDSTTLVRSGQPSDQHQVVWVTAFAS